MYSLFRLFLGKDAFDLVGVVLNTTDLAAGYHWSGVCYFASDIFCFQPVSPMNLGFVMVMSDKGLYDPAINLWISLKLRRNNGMEVITLVGRASGIVSSLACPDFRSVCALE